jgi:hypothetical protein
MTGSRSCASGCSRSAADSFAGNCAVCSQQTDSWPQLAGMAANSVQAHLQGIQLVASG